MEYNERFIEGIIDDYLFLQKIIEENEYRFCTAEFRKTFNRLYTVRQKTKGWMNSFYSVFYDCYCKNYSFRECMQHLYEEVGQIHPSLCSRIITTLNPKKPSWDSNAIRCMGIVLKEPKKKAKETKDEYARRVMDYYSRIYSQIEKEYQTHLDDDNINRTIQIFDINIPKAASLDKMKKIDLMIWSLKDRNIKSVLEYNSLLDKTK